MNIGALFLLFGSMGWLKYQDCLSSEEYACRVEELEEVNKENSKLGGFLTGCAENRFRGWMKIEAHTVAVSYEAVRQRRGEYTTRDSGRRTDDPYACLGYDGSACFTSGRFLSVNPTSLEQHTQDKVELDALPILLRCIACSAQERLIFSSTSGIRVRFWNTCC